MIVIAHRGASAYLPEHTKEAKALAYGIGPDYIEQDVVLSKDNVPVVIHDIHLETTTNVAAVYPNKKREDGRYYVVDFNWNELQKLQVSERFDSHTNQAIYQQRFPLGASNFKLHTLQDEIEMIQGLNISMQRNVGIYVEIKEPKFHRKEGKDISKIVLSVLAKYGYSSKDDACILQCFDAVELEKIRRVYQSNLFLVQLLEIGYLNESIRGKFAEEIVSYIASYADGIGPWYKQIVKGKHMSTVNGYADLVQLAHQKKLKVHAFTFRADDLEPYTSFEDLLQVAIDLDLDGVFTDHPDKAVSFFKKKNH